MKNLGRTIRPTPSCWLADCAESEKHINDLGLFYNILVKDKRLFGNQAPQVTYTGEPHYCLVTHQLHIHDIISFKHC